MEHQRFRRAGDPVCPHSQIKLLVEVARALRDNPWYFAVVLCAYLDGYFITTLILGVPASLWVFPELATGLIWVCLITTIALAATGEFVPPTRTAACYCLVFSLVVSTGSLGIVLVVKAAGSALGMLADATRELHGMEPRLLVWIGSAVVAILLCVVFFLTAVRSLRKAVRTLTKMTRNHEHKATI